MKGALQLLAVSAAAALGGVHAFIPSLPSSTPAPGVAGPKGKQVHKYTCRGGKSKGVVWAAGSAWMYWGGVGCGDYAAV